MSSSDSLISLASCLAGNARRFDRTRLTSDVAARACAHIADTIGVALAGMHEDCTRALLATPGIGDGPGASLLFATNRRTSVLDAALINGTAAHALDLDDVSSVLGGHPSAPLVAPLLAVAEERGLSGEAVLLAYIVGVEVETRFARAVHLHHYDKGWHPTATLGIFGAAAAVAHLMTLSVAQTTTALAIAASLAGGLKANFGTMTKPLHIGQCARNGVMAALLAERGFTANPEALEHDQGFLNVFNGAGTYSPEPLQEEWLTLAIESQALALKHYACCRSAQPAIAMALEIAQAPGFSADKIARIDIRVPARGLRHTDRAAPRTALEAKFSVQYAVARALADGEVRLSDFEGHAVLDPPVRKLLARTAASAHPDMHARGPADWAAEVTVTTSNGECITRKIDVPAHTVVMTEQQRRAKFQACATRALPAAQADALYQSLQHLGTISDIRTLTALLAEPAQKNRPSSGR